MTSVPPAFLMIRAVSRTASMSCVGSSTTNRSIPLLTRHWYTSSITSGWAFSHEMNRNPVPMNCSRVSGIAARASRSRSHGLSRCVRTDTPIAVLDEKSSARNPTRFITGAICATCAVRSPVAPHSDWLPSRSDTSTSSRSATTCSESGI